MVPVVKVPQSSVPGVNDDTLHASHAWKNAKIAFICSTGTIRYQVHFVKESHSLPDGIHYRLDFKPRLLQAKHTYQHELDAVMDVTCGESPAVEEASTEASASPRRSDEPEPGSPTSLLQQAGCGSRARRFACSSTKE